MKTDVNVLAAYLGGICIGPSQTDGSRKKFVWQCDQGHIWEARADSVKRGTWCPICNHNNQKNTLDEMRILANQFGGECLSQVYENSHTKLQWKCKNGHVFETTPSHVKGGRWCKICGNQTTSVDRRISMQEIREIATSRNGNCLSESYEPKIKLIWQCQMGHIWRADLHNVKSGSWCPVCRHKNSGRTPLSIEEMREIAASYGGQCLSDSYENVETKLKWMCKNGHIWKAIPSSVKKGHWCPECAGKSPLTLSQAQEIAQERGGKCLSEDCNGVHKNLLWQCAENHTWLANYANISMGRWCPECSSSIGERICRAFFEQLFGNTFPKARPSWLINQDGYQMELDGYSEELALAFEHQGRQHYQQIERFYPSKEQFQKRQADDARKKGLCQENGIILVDVPQIPDLLPVYKVQEYILGKCREIGFQVPDGAENIRVDLRKAYSPTAREKYQQICEIVSAYGGVCLSSAYVSSREKLRFRCKNGHEWETIPILILNGHWCPKCSSVNMGLVRRLTIREMYKLAEERGGRCVSTEYINANTHLLWECKNGHQWLAIPNSIKRGTWCPICAKENRKKFSPTSKCT
jgi:hypothetical protein